MPATVGRGPASPSRDDDGPLPHGWVRIPVTVQVALPPEVTRFEDIAEGAVLPVTTGPAPASARTEQNVRRLDPATGWPVIRGRWGGHPLPPETKLRMLNSLSAGPGDTRTPGLGDVTGREAAGLRPGELMAALRAVPGAVASAGAAKPEGTDPGSGASQVRRTTGERRIAGLPAVVMRGPGPGTSAPPPAASGGSGAATGAAEPAAVGRVEPDGATAVAADAAAVPDAPDDDPRRPGMLPAVESEARQQAAADTAAVPEDVRVTDAAPDPDGVRVDLGVNLGPPGPAASITVPASPSPTSAAPAAPTRPSNGPALVPMAAMTLPAGAPVGGAEAAGGRRRRAGRARKRTRRR